MSIIGYISSLKDHGDGEFSIDISTVYYLEKLEALGCTDGISACFQKVQDSIIQPINQPIQLAGKRNDALETLCSQGKPLISFDLAPTMWKNLIAAVDDVGTVRIEVYSHEDGAKICVSRGICAFLGLSLKNGSNYGAYTPWRDLSNGNKPPEEGKQDEAQTEP